MYETLKEAMRRKRMVDINYRPVKPSRGRKGHRIIEPHAMGAHVRNNRTVVRAWVNSGQSYTHLSEPPWRLFRLDHIRSAELLQDEFFVKPYNPRDKDMKNHPKRLTVGPSPAAVAGPRRSLRQVPSPRTRTRTRTARR